MVEILKPDICVIGAGSGGLTVAAAAAGFGVSVVLIEKGEMGGDCLNYGCVPSKALIAAAARAHDARGGARFGVNVPQVEVDFAAVNAHLRGVIASIAPNDSQERFTGLGVRVIRAPAQFVDRRTVTAGDFAIKARRFVVAAGSSPAVPPIDGIDSVPYLTNETIFELKRLPERLVVLGGGPIGMELAQAFHRLGSAVTVVEANKAMGRDDPELATLLMDRLRAEGIVVREGAAAKQVSRIRRNQIRLRLEDGSSVEGTHLLVAVGRKPNVEGLGLEAARVTFDARGIKVNSALRTRNRRVYAIGDINGGPMFTHWANYQAGLFIRSALFRFGGKADQSLLPWVTFTEPELAHVGLSENEARQRHGEIRILRWPFAENDRAQAERATEGHVKLIVSKRGRILGVDILGRHAGELIAPWALALTAKLSLRTIASMVLPYPTLSEAGKRAAISFYAPQARRRAVRRLIGFFRLFG